MDKLYYSPEACSLATMAALEAAAHPYEPVRVKMSDAGAGDEAYARINPVRQVPVLMTADGPIRENAAIYLHLAHAYPDLGLLPADAREQVRAATWVGFLGGTLHPAFRPIFRPTRFVGGDASAAQSLAATCTARLEQLVGIVADHMEGREWILERFSLVDFYLFVFERWASALDLAAAKRPCIEAHIRRVGELPSMVRALERQRPAG